MTGAVDDHYGGFSGCENGMKGPEVARGAKRVRRCDEWSDVHHIEVARQC